MSNPEDSNDHETVAIFEGEEAREFLEYALRESTPEEKEELKDDLDFYYQHCPDSPPITSNKI